MLEAGNVEAYEQGVLSITMPTRPEARPQKVSISTESRQEIQRLIGRQLADRGLPRARSVFHIFAFPKRRGPL
jgi:hypothetical protein